MLLARHSLISSVSSVALAVAGSLAAVIQTLGADTVIPSGVVVDELVLNEGDTGTIEDGGSVIIDPATPVPIFEERAAVQILGSDAVLNNNGTIRTTENAGGFGDGISVENQNATINNTGTIETFNPTAIAIWSSSSFPGPGSSGLTINNSGTIRANGDTTDPDKPFPNSSGSAIFLQGSSNFINNSGDISANGYAGHGIWLGFTTTDSFVYNSGTISAAGGMGYGIESFGDDFTLLNAGFIETAGEFGSAIRVWGENTLVENTNTVLTLGDGAHGIEVNRNDAIILNSGSIRTDGEDSNGIHITTGGTNASIHNGGNIRVLGEYSDGIYSAGNNAIVRNSGYVESDGENGNAIGVNGDNAHVINSGHLVAQPAPSAAAVNFACDSFCADTTAKLTLLRGSKIEGNINFNGHNSTLVVGSGLSIANTFDNAPVTIESASGIYAKTSNQVAVVDPTNLTTQDEQLTDLTSGISSAIESRLWDARRGKRGSDAANSQVTAEARTDPSHAVWMQAFGSYRKQGADSATAETHQSLGGFVIGADGLMNADIRAGFFGGASWADVDATQSDVDSQTNSYFMGAYASMIQHGLIFGLTLTAGYSDFDQERKVANNYAAGGVETATADFGGWFVSPELTITKPIDALGHPLEVSLSTRYAGLFTHSYTEKGTAAPLNVDTRNVHVGVVRAQMAAPNTFTFKNGSSFSYRPKAGIHARTNFGGETVTGALLGQKINFDDNGSSAPVVGFAGIDLHHHTGGGISFHAGAEGLLETDGSHQIFGQAGLKIRF